MSDRPREAPTQLPGKIEGTRFSWIDDGVLWLVNATVFHPRGFALARHSDDGTMVLLGDGSEPWSFPDTPDVHEKRAAVEALFERARQENGNPLDG